MGRHTAPIGMLIGLCALTSACTEQELVTSVIVVDPVDGTELDKRTRPGEAGWVRAAATPPGTEDVLAWGAGNFFNLRYEGEWREHDVVAAEFNFGPASGDAPPEIYAIGGYQAFIYSIEDEAIVAEAETHPLPYSVLAADWDGDGSTDLIASSPMDGAWFHPRTTDGLGELRPIVEALGLDQIIAVGDFDDDGNLDIVRPNSRNVDVGFAETEGYIDEVVAIGQVVDDVRDVAVGDITGDGSLDIVVTGEDGIQVIEYQGARTFSTLHHFTEMTDKTELMDVDSDGDLDLIGQPPYEDPREPYSTELLIAWNEGGVLADPEPLFDVGENVVDLVAGKDSDGNPWLAMSTWTYETVRAEPERRY